ncbi:unnamed protein product [Effrenium voratum]|nr:unnamed protein product [Effrenium voratum]
MNCGNTGASPLLRSVAHLGSVLAASSFATAGPLLPLHALARLDLSPPAPKRARPGAAALALGLVHMGPPPPVRSSARLGPAPSALSLGSLDPPPPLRSAAQPGPPLPASSPLRLAPPPSAPDMSHLGPTPLARSSARLDMPSPVSDFAKLGASPSIRGRVRLGASLFACGFCSASKLLTLSVVDALRVESSSFARGFARPELPPPVPDCSCSGLPPLLRSIAWLDPLPVAWGGARLGLPSSALGFSHPGASPALRGRARLAPAAPVVNFAQLGSFPSARSMLRPDFALSVLGPAQGGSLSVLGCSHSDASSSTQSSGCPEFVISVRGFASLALSPSLQGFLQADVPPLVLGLLRSGSTSFVSSFASLGIFSTLRSAACFDASLAVCNLGCSEFLPSLRSSSHLGVPPFAPSALRLDASPSTSGFAHFGAPPMPQSSARCGPAAPVSDCSHPGPSPLPRAIARAGSLLPPCGTARCGSTLPVLGCCHLELFMISQSLAWTDSAPSVLDMALLGVFPLLRTRMCVDLVLPVAGSASLGPPLAATDHSLFDPSLFIRSLLHSDFVAFAPSLSQPGTSLMLQCIS